MERSRPHVRQRGLTLIEACATLAIASILVGTAAPSFIETNTKLVLDGSAGELATDLYLARSAATAHYQCYDKSNQTHSVSLSKRNFYLATAVVKY